MTKSATFKNKTSKLIKAVVYMYTNVKVFLPRYATQSVVLLRQVVCLSVGP